MRVLVLGSGVIGVTSAWYLLEGGPRGHGARPPAGAGAGDQLRQCRRGLARLFRALGRPGHSDQGDEVAADAAPPASCSGRRSTTGCSAGSARCCATAPPPRYAHQQGAHGAAGRIQPRRAARRCATRPASPTTSAPRARCSCSAPRSSSTAVGDDIAVLDAYGVPYEVLDPAGCIGAEPALGLVPRQVRRRPAPAGRRDRRLRMSSPSGWPRWPRRAASSSATA